MTVRLQTPSLPGEPGFLGCITTLCLKHHVLFALLFPFPSCSISSEAANPHSGEETCLLLISQVPLCKQQCLCQRRYTSAPHCCHFPGYTEWRITLCPIQGHALAPGLQSHAGAQRSRRPLKKTAPREYHGKMAA